MLIHYYVPGECMCAGVVHDDGGCYFCALGYGIFACSDLDGVEVTFIRVGVTSVVGLVLLLAAAGLLALWAPIAVIYGLVVVDLAFIALLENGK